MEQKWAMERKWTGQFFQLMATTSAGIFCLAVCDAIPKAGMRGQLVRVWRKGVGVGTWGLWFSLRWATRSLHILTHFPHVILAALDNKVPAHSDPFHFVILCWATRSLHILTHFTLWFSLCWATRSPHILTHFTLWFCVGLQLFLSLLNTPN